MKCVSLKREKRVVETARQRGENSELMHEETDSKVECEHNRIYYTGCVNITYKVGMMLHRD